MLNWLNSLINFESTPIKKAPSLETINSLLECLGRPQDAFPTINITGTNGKGSTSLMVTQLLADSGLKVGTFTSPHLNKVNERIKINNIEISDEDLFEVLRIVQLTCELNDIKPTYFEALTACACYYFDSIAVDIGIMEVGLGGTWDCTNYESNNTKAHDHVIITSISKDHTEILGTSETEIAYDKTGLIKPNSTVLIGDMSEEVVDIINTKDKVELLRLWDDFEIYNEQSALGGKIFSLKNRWGIFENIYLPQYGKHQVINAAVSITCAMSFLQQGFDVDFINTALSQIKNFGRFEIISKNPLVVFDGAHNPGGGVALKETLEEDFPLYSSRVYIIGAKKGKKVLEFIESLNINDEDLIITTASDFELMMSPQELYDICKQMHENVMFIDDISKSLEYALDIVLDDGQIIITGSLYLYKK